MNPASEANVVSYLRRAAAEHGEREALVAGTRSATFGELWERVDRASAGLKRAGLRPGERVVLMVPMSIELYVVMLAVLKLGAVGVFVDPWIGRRQIAAFSAFAEPAAWIGIARSHLLRLLDPALRRIRTTVTTGRRIGPLPARLALAELERERGDGAIHAAAPEEPALVTFTTGSSGTPKGANRTHGFLAAQHAALRAEFPYRDEDVDMPMFPVFALNNLATGITSVIPSLDFARVAEVDAGAILEQVRARGVTTCTASPPFFDRIVERVAAGARPPALRRILTGGAPVSDRQLEAWKRALPATEIVVVYGSTEAEPVAHLAAEERLELARGDRRGTRGFCAGKPCPAVRARVIRIHDGPVRLGARGWEEWELPAGEVGELVVSGAHVGRDYYRNPRAVEENKIHDAEGRVWHRMGDTGQLDREGRFWLVGRVHSTIRRDGRLVHPQLVEQAALGDDAEIRRVAAVGMRDDRLGERVLVVVESAGGASVAQRVSARLAEATLPCDELRVTAAALPVDPRHNSKIDYAALRRTLT